MTVTPTSYCSLDEAWGAATAPAPASASAPALRRRKAVRSRLPPHQQQHQPPPTAICPAHVPLDPQNPVDPDEYRELYARPPTSTAATAVERFPGPPHQQPPQPDDDTAPFAKQFDSVFQDDEPVAQRPPPFLPTRAEREPSESPPSPSRVVPPARTVPPAHSYEHRTNGQRPIGSSVLDLVLYIVSGVLLIFVMDQFVQLGRLAA